VEELPRRSHSHEALLKSVIPGSGMQECRARHQKMAEGETAGAGAWTFEFGYLPAHPLVFLVAY